jgi:hypothetical protein
MFDNTKYNEAVLLLRQIIDKDLVGEFLHAVADKMVNPLKAKTVPMSCSAANLYAYRSIYVNSCVNRFKDNPTPENLSVFANSVYSLRQLTTNVNKESV